MDREPGTEVSRRAGMLCGFPHPQHGHQGGHTRQCCKINREPDGDLLGEVDTGQTADQSGIVHGRADDHGEDHRDRMPAHLEIEHPRPVGGPPGCLQRIVGQRFIGPAGSGLGGAAEDAIEKERPENHRHVSERHHDQDQHLEDHQAGGENHEPFAAEQVGQGARGYFQQDNGHGPDSVEHGEMFQGESIIEEQDGKHRVIEPRPEKDPVPDKQTDIRNFQDRCRAVRWVGHERQR